MEYKRQSPTAVKVKPRLIIHGGAGNIKPANLAPPQYAEYRAALLTIISKTNAYMTTPTPTTTATAALPSALETAVHAVTLLENNPLFNSGHGAVFTRDGINELEASVMVTRGFAKRGVGVTGLRHVRNPILLAKAMLEHGEADLGGGSDSHPSSSEIDAPSAQGHTLLHGPTAEVLAEKYGLELVEPGYFFTQRRWDEHIRALERERSGEEGNATWSKSEFLPQGTRSAGDRWRVTGEGEGGIIGIEIAVTRDEEGDVVGVRSEILQDFNCNGMYRAWIDDEGLAHAKIYHDEVEEGVDARLYAEKW
ncbi:Isoaspartyl peptidase [Colletotrichum sp. SAR 10_86]|nr:Isoaspartyl peptidase [Colletotrichum sp. SAR 10_76]KAI8216925.1 Isoaspartyl peptidase [Colletotrichum sp. SAR 10_86]